MSVVMDEEIKRWTARRKSALVPEIIQRQTTIAEASRQFDLTPSEIESWVPVEIRQRPGFNQPALQPPGPKL